MAKKVNFFMVDLYESSTGTVKDYKGIKDLMIEIINENAVKVNNFWVLDLTRDQDLHYIADIFWYDNKSLCMRISSQKLYIPSMLIHLHGQAVPVSRRMRTTLTETVPF